MHRLPVATPPLCHFHGMLPCRDGTVGNSNRLLDDRPKSPVTKYRIQEQYAVAIARDWLISSTPERLSAAKLVQSQVRLFVDSKSLQQLPVEAHPYMSVHVENEWLQPVPT